MSDEAFGHDRRRKRGQLPFAALFFIGSALLLSQLGGQTVWVDNTQLFAQPAFWPSVSLIGMAGFGALHLRHLPRHRLTRPDRHEAAVWASALEFAVWFLVYVLAVPRIGYLPTTLLFAALLTWRMGYRSRAMLWTSLGFGLAVVVLFKGLLSVRIPGAALYDYLPGALRSFFILNF